MMMRRRTRGIRMERRGGKRRTRRKKGKRGRGGEREFLDVNKLIKVDSQLPPHLDIFQI